VTTRQITSILVLTAVCADARPTAAVRATIPLTNTESQRENLIRGAILEDRAAEYSVVSAADLGMTSRNAFATLNGGVDSQGSDCLCLRPGNYALQGTGRLGRASDKAEQTPGTTLRSAVPACNRRRRHGR
jgi:hypothetical protein